MTSSRGDAFPSTSIGRTQGSGSQRPATSANRTLRAHPLLASDRASSPTLVDSEGSLHLPYIPRHRVLSSSSARENDQSLLPSSSHQRQQKQTDLTSELYFVHLKAAAKNVGVLPGSVGWGILERLVLSDGDAEWTHIWNIVTSGKATLLLPLEDSTNDDKITPDFVKDHTLLYDDHSRINGAPAITFSGLRGVIIDKTLTFRSTLHPLSKGFPAILSSGLSVLPPLPPIPPTTQYPEVILQSHTTALPLPPRTYPRLKTKASLRHRPSSSNGNPSPMSRISNPFASFFGTQTPTLLPSPPVQQQEEPIIAPLIEVSAFIIQKKILRADIGRHVNRALKQEVKDFLLSSKAGCSTDVDVNIPQWVTERVHEITSGWYPFVQEPTMLRRSAAVNREESPYTVAWVPWDGDEVPERVQEFYRLLEADLRVLGSLGRTELHQDDADTQSGNVEKGGEHVQDDTRVTLVMERIEECISVLFYDRLYRPLNADDSLHDEVLSSRIAALNLVGMGLEHLDVSINEEAHDGLKCLTQACGGVLRQINQHFTPRDKAAVFVHAHKIIVDGLSQLPPIRLMTEDESKARKNEIPPTSSTSSTSTDQILISEKRSSTEITEPRREEATHQLDSSNIVVPDHLSKSFDHQDSPDHFTAPSSAVPSTPTPVSTDILLPFLIFSIVKENPPQLVSQLLYTQRFRNASPTLAGNSESATVKRGEEEFCLVNLLGVVRFLEEVDFSALGLESGIISSATPTPPLTPLFFRSPADDNAPGGSGSSTGGMLGMTAGVVKGRVEQANKMLSGVVDTSVGMFLRAISHGTVPVVAARVPSAATTSPQYLDSTKSYEIASRNSGKSNLLGMDGSGNETLKTVGGGFSMRNFAASIPLVGKVAMGSTGSTEEEGRPLLPVLLPSGSAVNEQDSEGRTDYGGGVEVYVNTEGDRSEPQDVDDDRGRDAGTTDTKSIRSFENMLHSPASGKGVVARRNEGRSLGKTSALSNSGNETGGEKSRESLSDRLAKVGSFAAATETPSSSRRSSLLQTSSRQANHTSSSSPSRTSSPTRSNCPDALSKPRTLRLDPPVQRFLECSPGDLKLSEVVELLRDYHRLVRGIRDIGGFTG